MASIDEELKHLRDEIEKSSNDFKKLNDEARNAHSRLKIYNVSLNGSISGLKSAQAAAAKQVELRSLELSLQRKLMEQSKKLLADNQKKLNETKKEIPEFQKENAETRSLIADKEAAKKSVLDSIASLRQEDESRKKYIDALKEKAAASYEDARYTRSQLAAVSEEQKATEANINLLQDQEQAQKSLLESIRKQVKDITKGKSPDQLKRLSGGEKDSLRALRKQEAEVSQELNRTLQKQKEENQRKDSLAKTQTELADELKAVNAFQKSLMDTANLEQTERQKLADSMKEGESELGKLNSDLSNLNDKTNDLTEKVSDLTKSAEEYRDAINDGKDAIKQQKDAMNQAIQDWVNANKDRIQLDINTYRRYQAGLAEISRPLQDFVDSIRKIQQTFGITASQVLSIGFGDLKNVVGTTISALLSFGKSGPPVSMEQIMGAREAFQEEFGGLLTSDAATELAQQAVNMGVTAKQLAQARRVFMTTTMGDVGEAKLQTDKFIGEFAKKGLTSKDAMLAIAQYSELLARNGTRFATSFTRAAADAKKIGIDLNKISQVGDNIINDFEGFLESQAELGAMGFGFDTSRLAQLAATGDDAALYRELRSQLAVTGKDITRLSRPERLSLESAFGLNIGEMQRMASGAGSGEKTIEQINLDGNDLLGSAVSFLSGISKSALATNALLGVLIALQRFNSLRYTVAGAAMQNPMLGAAGMGLGGLGLMGGSQMLASMMPTPTTGAIVGGLGAGLGALMTAGGLANIPALAPFLSNPFVLAGIAIAAAGLGAYSGYKSVSGKSQGGLITGPGSGTSDSILTRLSNGEYVMRADAVRTIGVDTLDRMNKIPGKALGGLIGTVASKSGLLTGLMSKYAKFGMPMMDRASGMLANVQAMKDKYASLGGLSGLKGSLMEKGTDFLSKKIPGLSGAMSAISAFKEGGMKGTLGSLAKGGIGKAIGGAIGTAIPIPFVGTAVGSLLGSKVGKFAGSLFGKKSPKDMLTSVAQTVVPKIPGMERFTPTLEAMGAGATAPSTATPPLVAQKGGMSGGKTDGDAIGRAVAAAVAAALQGVHVKMDGTSVGKILVNANDAASTLGVFRQTSRATI
jgi:hypothetical protein